MLFFRSIRRHYELVAAQLTLKDWEADPESHNTVILPISGVYRGRAEGAAATRRASAARTFAPCTAETDPRHPERSGEQWETWGHGVRWWCCSRPIGRSCGRCSANIVEADDARPDNFVTVVLPEFVPARSVAPLLLHNQRALLIKGALLFKPNTIVTSVPFHLRGK